jgi:23S rRNA pseudouridine1911/1915/1917 synthase
MSGNRAGIVHRLDRATSGVMILAKNPDTLSMLQKQFSQRKTKKAYEAIIVGSLPNPEANIDMPIERNPKKPQTFRVGVNGKTAQTYYKTVKTNDKYSLLELKPVTGRTHQLRVHLKQLDHPIVGDTLYGGKVADRLYLHAKSLEITVPGSQRKVFDAEVPKEFDQLLK